MKKILAIIITALVLVTAIAVPAMAARNARQASFVDADNDGICDNRAESCPAQNENRGCKGAGYTDADNDGICDNRSESCPAQNEGRGCKGAGYTDADNDGICDNRGAKCKGQLKHCKGNR